MKKTRQRQSLKFFYVHRPIVFYLTSSSSHLLSANRIRQHVIVKVDRVLIEIKCVGECWKTISLVNALISKHACDQHQHTVIPLKSKQVSQASNWKEASERQHAIKAKNLNTAFE